MFAANALGLAGLFVLFIGMPWIVRLIFGLKPLPPSALRDRLLATAHRVGFQFSDILLWNTRNGMANALVVGLVPWVRYVVFTDRLVEEFPEEEVEAVFGHEIGHIKHHHMTYYLGFLMMSMAVLGLVVQNYLSVLAGLFPAYLAETVNNLTRSGDDFAAIPLVFALVSYVFIVFGFLSRRCERQADIYGCRVVSCGDPACRGHTEDQALPAGAPCLCPTGIRTFIQALEKVAVLNGISRDRPGYLQSWQHSTIAKRVAFLQRMRDDPAIERAFQRRVAVIKWALFLVLGVALAVLVSMHGPPT
jgi:Zn-dependent protease with chaperone function